MKNFMNNIIDGFSAQVSDDQDRGDLVQTVIIIAGFAVVAIAVVGWISTAVFGLGADTAKCITTYGEGLLSNSSTQCYNGHSYESEWQINRDETYRNRFNFSYEVVEESHWS